MIAKPANELSKVSNCYNAGVGAAIKFEKSIGLFKNWRRNSQANLKSTNKISYFNEYFMFSLNIYFENRLFEGKGHPIEWFSNKAILSEKLIKLYATISV